MADYFSWLPVGGIPGRVARWVYDSMTDAPSQQLRPPPNAPLTLPVPGQGSPGGELGPPPVIMGSPVVGEDLPPLPTMDVWSPPRMSVPMANAPASRRLTSTRPAFIYTNPVAASQAAADQQSRLSFELGQDQGFRDYLARLTESQAMTDRTRMNSQAIGNQNLMYLREGDANRASAERIAALTAAARRQAIDDANYEEQLRLWQIGQQTADMLNADPNAKVSNRHYAWLNPSTGKWEPRFPQPMRPPPPAPPGVGAVRPPAIGAPMVSPSQAPIIAAPSALPPSPPPAVAAPIPAWPGPAPMIELDADLGPLTSPDVFRRNSVGGMTPPTNFEPVLPRTQQDILNQLAPRPPGYYTPPPPMTAPVPFY